MKLAGAAGLGLNGARLGCDGGLRRRAGGCLVRARLQNGDGGKWFEGQQRLGFQFGLRVFLDGEVALAFLAGMAGGRESPPWLAIASGWMGRAIVRCSRTQRASMASELSLTHWSSRAAISRRRLAA
jgi:hypothetical protein